MSSQLRVLWMSSASNMSQRTLLQPAVLTCRTSGRKVGDAAKLLLSSRWSAKFLNRPARVVGESNAQASSVAHDSEEQSDGQASWEPRAESGRHASTRDDLFPFIEEDDTEERRHLRRKTEALMEILKAGDQVESVIEQHSNQIDDEMVDILDKRTRLAARMKEGDKIMHGLYLVKRRLLSEISKNKATPAQRLLDVLLDMLEPDASPDVQELEIEEVLAAAFQPPQMPHIDIFATAARIAEGEEVATPVPEEQGHVPQDVFITETEKLLVEAASNTEELHRTLENGNLGKREAAYRHVLGIRQQTLLQVHTILEVAKRM